VGVPEVGLVAEVVLEACSAVGAGVVGLGLPVGLSVEEAFVGGSAVLGVEGALASGLAADVWYGYEPLLSTMGVGEKGCDAVGAGGPLGLFSLGGVSFVASVSSWNGSRAVTDCV
jgi:hypothetical protein